MYFDSCGNSVRVRPDPHKRKIDGCDVEIVTLIEEGRPSEEGYVVMKEETEGAGWCHNGTPYGRPCVAWWGRLHKYPTAEALIRALADK